MSQYYEQFLKPCPVCDGKITDKSYDRGIIFKCFPCGYSKEYPGLLQTKVSPVPIPYVDKEGNKIDPKDVKCQEYYHSRATEDAISEFNKWVDERNSSRTRDSKIDEVLKKVYVLNCIINGTTITTIGVFDDMDIMLSVMDKWKLVNGIEMELYFKELHLNIDDLSASPEKYFNKSEMEAMKPYIRDSKIEGLLDGY